MWDNKKHLKGALDYLDTQQDCLEKNKNSLTKLLHQTIALWLHLLNRNPKKSTLYLGPIGFSLISQVPNFGDALGVVEKTTKTLLLCYSN